jgi:hypothetical protein
MRPNTNRIGRLLRLIVRRFLRPRNRLGVMIVGCHQVVLFGNRFAMPQPCRRNVGGKGFPKFRRAGCTKILEQLRPGC